MSDSTTTSPSTSSGAHNNKWNPAQEFKKGSKRDPLLFPKLRDFAQWDNWNTEFTTITKVQNCESILDELYFPSSAEDKELFEQQQIYMFSVLIKIVKVDEGWAIIRKEKTSLNSQKV